MMPYLRVLDGVSRGPVPFYTSFGYAVDYKRLETMLIRFGRGGKA